MIDKMKGIGTCGECKWWGEPSRRDGLCVQTCHNKVARCMIGDGASKEPLRAVFTWGCRCWEAEASKPARPTEATLELDGIVARVATSSEPYGMEVFVCNKNNDIISKTILRKEKP